MYRSLVGVLSVYCTNWPCERNCGRIHKQLMQRKKSSLDLMNGEKSDEVKKKVRNSSIDQGGSSPVVYFESIFSTDQSFEEASPRTKQLELSEKPAAEPSASLVTPKEQTRNFSFSSNRSVYNRSNSKAHSSSPPVMKPISSDLNSILTDDDSLEYARLDLTMKRPISSDDSSVDYPRRLLDLHNHGSFEQGIHTLEE